MKALKILGLTLVVALAVVAVAAPIGPLPGFFIGGTQTSLPATWNDTRQIHEIKLRVGEGVLPRVVVIWVVQVEGDLYVVGSKGSGWVSRLGNGAPVSMRMGDSTYDMQATLVSMGWEQVLEAYVEKYQADYPDIVQGFPDIEEAAETTAVFRLTAPTSA
ncbi:MAG: hypothetical protein ACR2PZ_15435 [Pseudomonadales bacterium]